MTRPAPPPIPLQADERTMLLAFPADPFAELDWEADRGAEMTVAEAWSVDELFAQFDAAVVDSRARVDAASSLDELSVHPDRHGEHWSLRWIVVHMIEEYARHCGHADLIRESIDGDVDS